jgi:transposase
LETEVFMGRKTVLKRKHAPAVKLEAVRILRERLAAGGTWQRVSEELDVGVHMLRVWAQRVAEASAGATADDIFPGSGHARRGAAEACAADAMVRPQPVSAEEEVRRLSRENERLRMERDFLKKATAFFARESP